MTTTDFYQTVPEYYSSYEDCKNTKNAHRQTNPRYRNFTQDIFHAGDEEQFQQYRDATNGNLCTPDITLDKNVFGNQVFDIWDGYANLEAIVVLNTFRYIFHKFKKGIFVKIKNNQLDVFLPFSKAKFVNEWGDKIKVENGNIENFINNISQLEGRRRSNINRSTNTWYANNCLIRYEYPPGEGDSNVLTVKNMLKELCKHRHIPDIEFFLNRRDFPILTRDKTEAYHNLWGSTSQPLVSHSYEQYSPILSMSVNNNHADIPIPTHEDWARVQSLENIFFKKSCCSMTETFDFPWENKKPIAVFRGGSTGCGVTMETNPRLKVAYLSFLDMQKQPSEQLLDAGITNWNLRPRKLLDSEFLQTIDILNLPFYNQETKGLVGKLSRQEQSHYKYIINIDGHVSAFRLSIELNIGSVVLLVKSSWKIWYSDMLVPYKHYVPVNEDLSDLMSQIQWCKDHDQECQEIVANAKEFYNMYLQKNGIFDYMQKIIIDMKKKMGLYIYNFVSPLDLQIQNESTSLFNQNNRYPETTKNITDISHFPIVERCYGFLQGVQWIVKMINHLSNLELIATEGPLIMKNKLGYIRKLVLNNYDFVVKTTNDPQKIKEHIHEAFVGAKCINNILKHIPNFAYIFDIYQNNYINVVVEYIEGQTLSSYIKSTDFKISEYLIILIQISLAIQVAQKLYGFVHYDLTPWNIVLKKYDKPINIDYIIGYNNIIRVKTTIVPMIIDYGKSHMIYKNTHYGFIHMYKTSTVQDIFTILITSLNELLEHQKQHLDMILKLANFLTNTTFSPKPFETEIELQTFINNNKSYANLVCSDKSDLENKTPYDFFKHIDKIVKNKFKIPYGKVAVYQQLMDKGNGRQVFDYILSRTDEERVDSYINVFNRIRFCSFPQPDNLFFVYYAAQSLENNLLSVGEQMEFYIRSRRINNPEYATNYISTMKLFYKIYDNIFKMKKEKTIQYSISDSFSTLILAPYDENTFLLPETISNLVRSYGQTGDDLSDYSDIIEYILINNGKYKLPDNDRNFYVENFRQLLNTSSLIMKNNVANVNTLRKTAENVYKINVDNITRNQLSNCELVVEHVIRYSNIIRYITDV